MAALLAAQGRAQELEMSVQQEAIGSPLSATAAPFAPGRCVRVPLMGVERHQPVAAALDEEDFPVLGTLPPRRHDRR